MAGLVTRAGVARGDVVTVVMPDGPELLSMILGVSSVAICAPVNPGLRDAEMEACWSDQGTRALILEAGDARLEEIARKLGIAVLHADRGDPPAMNLGEHARASDIALVLQTSATTGKPRMVPITHATLRAMAENTRRILRLAAEDRFLSLMPLFHLQGLLSSIAQLLAGGSVIATSGFDSSAFASWLGRFHPTWYTATPAVHHAILPLMEMRPEVLEQSPLRFVRSIGAPMPQTLMDGLERVLRVPVLEGYGMTETGMVTSNAPPPRTRRAGSAGQSAGVEVAILSDAGEILPAHRDGEIAVRGSAVIHGYLNNVEADRSAFRDGWFLTGDIGRLDEEGFLFVTGRIKDIINRGGEKVLPAEIDDALAAHPAVADAVAFGVPHPTLGEDVAAAVVLKDGAAISEAELRRFAASRLAEFKIPRRIIFPDAIPKGATGKALRAELAERFQSEVTMRANGAAALTPVEQKLKTIWKRVLRIEEAGVEDDFFGSGGDSLGLTLLMAEIEFEFGVDSSLVAGAEFYASPTIRTLAKVIANGAPAATKGTRAPFVALQPLGSRIPFFCIPGADENPYYFRELAKGLGQDQPFYVLRDTRPLQERGVYSVEEHAAHFADAIRVVKERGPYILGGHCYGGILAFETARQLISRGDEVRLLAFFDVPAPGYPKIVRHWRNYLSQSKLLIAALARGEDHATWADVRSHLRVLMELSRRKIQAFTRRGLVATGLRAVVEPIERVNYRNERAGRAYDPKQLRCKLVQFIAADERHSTLILDDPRLGWRDLVGDGFSVRKVTGKAAEIFREPSVGELADRFRGVLDEINGEYNS